MPFEDTIRLVNEVRRGMRATGESLEEAVEARDLLSADIDNARKRLKRKQESTSYPNSLIDGIIKTLKTGNILETTLITEIERATETNTEFEHSDYKQRLFEVAKEKDIYNFIRVGTGWNTRLLVQITFEERAGTLSDYARGITAYRNELKTREGKPGSGRGIDATLFWANRVYGTPLEHKTVQRRIELSGRPAPFWQILNSGSVSLPSDRQDEAYNPIPATPTDFIGLAETALSSGLLTNFDEERSKWFDEAYKLSLEIDEAVDLRNRFTEEIKRLRADVETAQHRNQLNRIGIRVEDINKRKLRAALKKYRAGEEFETPTIQVGKKGRDVTITIAQLEGLAEL